MLKNSLTSLIFAIAFLLASPCLAGKPKARPSAQPQVPVVGAAPFVAGIEAVANGITVRSPSNPQTQVILQPIRFLLKISF